MHPFLLLNKFKLQHLDRARVAQAWRRGLGPGIERGLLGEWWILAAEPTSQHAQL